MQEYDELSKLAYIKSEELEQELKTVKHRVNLLEILYGTTPPPPDPDDTEDVPYVPPLPSELLSTGEEVLVPVYYEASTTNYDAVFPYLFFISQINSTFIAKLTLNLNIVSNPKSITIQLFVDDVLSDSYSLVDPLVGSYAIPFANAHISEQLSHRIQYKIVPTGGTECVYKVIDAKYEILGNNVLVLNPPKKYSVYFNNGIYYVSKCEQGYSNYLMQSKTALNLNAPYTQHQQNAIEQQFCHSYERIDYVWQTVNLGYFYRSGNGFGYLVNFNDPSKVVLISTCYGFDFLPDLSTTYGGVAIFCNNGVIYYYDVNPEFSSRATRTVENGESYYVDVTGVKLLYDNFSIYPHKAKLVATRSDGTNVFFSKVKSYYKVELGFGINVSANYANEDGSIIHVYMRTFDQLVRKVLTLNLNTNMYELTSETSLGTWQKYMAGSAPAYFTINSTHLLTYHPQ